MFKQIKLFNIHIIQSMKTLKIFFRIWVKVLFYFLDQTLLFFFLYLSQNMLIVFPKNSNFTFLCLCFVFIETSMHLVSARKMPFIIFEFWDSYKSNSKKTSFEKYAIERWAILINLLPRGNKWNFKTKPILH